MPVTFHRDSLLTFTIFILPLFILALIALYKELTPTTTTTTTATTTPAPNMATKPSNNSLNVFKKPLALFSKEPLTGFYRDGYCRVGKEDGGNHAVAGVLTKEFLDFTASRGNNLRSIGLEPGCKWCLCTTRWKEAVDAAKGADDPVVPKVHLHATDQSALQNGVTMDVLKKFSAEGEVEGSGGRLGQEPKAPETPGGIARETH